MRLLETSSEGRSERTDAIASVYRKTIEMLMRIATGVEPASDCVEGLRLIVEAASALALDVGKQRALYKFERPSGSSMWTPVSSSSLFAGGAASFDRLRTQPCPI